MIARLFSMLQVLLMSALLMGGVSAVAQAETPPPGGPGGPGGPGMMRHFDPERMQAMIKARLAKLHERLEIKASQQAAWDAFAKSVEALPQGMTKPPGPDADATTLARFRADRAQGFAKKLAVIADTTAKLEGVLSADQRKILDDASHHFGHGGYGHGGCGHRGMGGQGMGGGMGGGKP